jgi:antitoxin MazE
VLTDVNFSFKLCLDIKRKPNEKRKCEEITMTEAVLDIKQWGNNLGVRLPVAVARAAHLHVDQRVLISVEDGTIVIRPIEDAAALTLEQRLARFDPMRHGGEVMQSQAVGAERW